MKGPASDERIIGATIGSEFLKTVTFAANGLNFGCQDVQIVIAQKIGMHGGAQVIVDPAIEQETQTA